MPAELHEALAAEAQRQGVSLNALIVTLLAGAIGWRTADIKESDHAAQ